MKKIVAVFMLVALSGCVSATPVAQPTPTPKPDFSAGKPTLTPQVIELPKPQPKSVISMERIWMLPGGIFNSLPPDATQATFGEFPWMKADPSYNSDPQFARAIIWDLYGGNFYTFRIGAGNVAYDGWNGPGRLGDPDSHLTMVCIQDCNRWPLPASYKIDAGAYPDNPKNASLPPPPWVGVDSSQADPTSMDALIMDFYTGNPYKFRFPKAIREEFDAGWYFGPVKSTAVRIIGLCFTGCTVTPARH